MIYALMFAVISVIAGMVGYSDISHGVATVAKVVYFGASIMFVIFLGFAKFSRPKMPLPGG